MNNKKLQKFYARAMFKSNNSTEINTVRTNFKNKFNFKISLTNQEILKEKNNALGGFSKLDLEKLCQKISNEDIEIKLNSIDIFYEYKTKKNSTEKREEKVFIITTQNMNNKLKDKNIENYFIDITYKIIPKHFKGYKLMTITGVDKITKNTYICCFILLKYEDEESFIKIFKYLREMYLFNPLVVNIDYSASLTKALKNENLFDKPPIITHCFFHFTQSIVRQMKKYKLIKSKMTKYGFEILKNVEIICFIPPSYINSYSKFLKTKLKEENEINLYNYIEKNWLKKYPGYFNYYELFENINLQNGIEHFYATNNIAESLHSKLGLYLPYKKVNNNNFIISIRNVLLNYETKNESIIRKDYVTKSLILYVKTIKKGKYEWLKYEQIVELEKKIINGENNKVHINVINELIKSINNIDLNNKNDSINNFNSNLDSDLNENINMDMDNNSKSQEENESNEESNSYVSETEIKDEYGKGGLFERLLKDDKNLKYNGLIYKIKISKNSKKRNNFDVDDDEDFKEMKNIIDLKSKKKIKYPKK